MKCQVCGCTDTSACEGGCFWVYPTLCSRCVLNKLAEVAPTLDDEARRQFLDELTCLAEAVDPDLADAPAFASDDPRAGVDGATAGYEDWFDQFDATPRLWRPGDPV